MKNFTLLLLLLFSFTAQAQLYLNRGQTTERILVSTSGGTCTEALTLTAPSTLQTLDNKEYIISGNITGAFGLTAELFAGSTLTISGAPTYTGSTTVKSGELILTNTQGFKSLNLNVSAVASLTFDASAHGGTSTSASPYLVFGSGFTSDFTVIGAGQVKFKGAVTNYYGVYSSTNKSMRFNMEVGGQLNINGGKWTIGASGVEVFAGNLGSLNLVDATLTIQGTTAQFDKITGNGSIYSPDKVPNENAATDLNIIIGVRNGTCDWGGGFSNYPDKRKINIEKMGTGTITFSGINNQKGTVTITEGTLIGIRDICHEAYEASIVVNNNGTYILNQNKGTFSNGISGGGHVIKRGDGAILWTGGPTTIVGYTGPTTIESGELGFRCKEIESSSITVKSGCTLTCYSGAENYATKGITSKGSLSMNANSTIKFYFGYDSEHPTTLTVNGGITAPDGFLVKLTGSTGPESFKGDITLIKCSGTLPTTLPTLVENSLFYKGSSYSNDLRKCITLWWKPGTGLVATFSETNLTISGSLSAICIGGTKNYTITNGGTPATPVAWTVSNNVATISNAGVVTGLFNGTSSVMYTNTSGCMVSTDIVVVGHVIRPEDPNADFCVGKRITLKAYNTPTGGSNAENSNAWFSDNELIATVENENEGRVSKPVCYVTIRALGTAIIKFRSSSHNCGTAEYTISVKTAATTTAYAGTDKEICAGKSVAIGPTPQTGIIYSWSPATGLSASNVANPTANPTVTTIYTLATTRSATECTSTDPVEVKVNPLPDITSAQGPSSQILPAATLTLTTSAIGTAGLWASSDVAKVTIAAVPVDAKSATATGKVVGKANITYTDPKGCIGTHEVTVSTSTKTNQTIDFPDIQTKTVGDENFTLPATTTSTSNLPITYHTTYTDKVTITGNKAKFVKAGKVQIEARLAENNTYYPATKTSNLFCINPAQPTISTNNKTLTSSQENGNQWYLNETPIAVGATGKTYIATTDGNYTVKVTVEGCVSIPSAPVSISTPVSPTPVSPTPGKKSQTITFDITDKTVGDTDFTLEATTNAPLNLPFTYSTTYTDKVIITGTKAKFVKAGKARILADQAGDDTYDPANKMSDIFCINPAKPDITTENKTLISSAEHGNQWYANEKSIDGATAQKYIPTPAEYGSYTVKATVEGCVSALSEPFIVVVTGDNSANELHIFPNPVHDQLVIELPAHENGLISLFSVTGQSLHSTAASGKAIISMKDFPVGIYILKIQTAGKTVVKKVVRN